MSPASDKHCHRCGREVVQRVSELGLCAACDRVIRPDVLNRGRIINASLKIARESKNAETRLARYRQVLLNLDALMRYEKQGVVIAAEPRLLTLWMKVRSERDALESTTLWGRPDSKARLPEIPTFETPEEFEAYAERGFAELRDFNKGSARAIALQKDADKALKRGDPAAAEASLLAAVAAWERVPHINCYGVAPWPYERLAILYRKQKRYADEVAILERFGRQTHAPGVGPRKLGERLAKARRLAAKHRP